MGQASNGFSGCWPRPFAVGVLVLPGGVDEDTRTAERLGLALDAYRYGYFLLDIVEIRPDGHGAPGGAEDGAGGGYAEAEALAARADADAFVTRGPVDDAALSAAASRRRLVVRGADGPGTAERD